MEERKYYVQTKALIKGLLDLGPMLTEGDVEMAAQSYDDGCPARAFRHLAKREILKFHNPNTRQRVYAQIRREFRSSVPYATHPLFWKRLQEEFTRQPRSSPLKEYEKMARQHSSQADVARAFLELREEIDFAVLSGKQPF